MDRVQTVRAARNAIFIFLACALLSALTFRLSRADDTARRGYLVRPAAGEETREETLVAKSGNEKNTVVLPVAPRHLTEKETGEALSRAEKILSEYMDKQTDANHTDHDLHFPETLTEVPVQIAWSTDAPLMLAFDGSLGDAVPEEGAAVRAVAEISLQEHVRIVSFAITVFPPVPDDAEAYASMVQRSVAQTADPYADTLILPDTLSGQTVSWSHTPDLTWLILLLLGASAAVLYYYMEYTKPIRAREARQEEILADYPQITGKLVLLLHAGMSMRLALRKITLDYGRKRAKGAPERAGYEEIAKAHYAMNRGITEPEAYRRLGRESGSECLRTLSVLLTANLTKGSSTLLSVLDKEAAEACDKRKKRARMRGEKAGVKLLGPMMMMLGVVLVILMVPAFMTFF